MITIDQRRFNYPVYDFSDTVYSKPTEENNHFIENLFEEEGAFGEADCAGL